MTELVREIDPRGKVCLSMRVVDQESGAELEDTRPAREPRGDRPGGDRDRGPRRDGGRDGGGDRGPRRDGGGDRAPRHDREEGGNPEHLPAFLKNDD